MRVGRTAACLICESQGRQPTFLCLIPALLPDILSVFGNKGCRHGTSMKSLFSLIFLFLFANSAFAANLCDNSCNLTITFPTGGSITAVEPLTFTFGDAGLVDTVATSTAYVNGNTLLMGAGEVLTFAAGGSLDLGAAGNLGYSSIAITTDGDINIQAVAGTETIYLFTITLSGTANLSLTAVSIAAEGDVTIGVDGALSFNAPGSTSNCETTSSSSVTLTGSTGTPMVIDTSDDCNTISTDIGVALGSVSITDPNAGGTLVIGEITPIENGGSGGITLDSGELTLNGTDTGSGSFNVFFVLFLALFRMLRNIFSHSIVLYRIK